MNPADLRRALHAAVDAFADVLEGADGSSYVPSAPQDPANDPAPKPRRRGLRPRPDIVLSDADKAFGKKLLRRLGRG